MDLDVALCSLAANPAAAMDTAELALAVARDEYPGLDTEAYLSELNGMAREARDYLRGGLEARTRGLCRYLFHDQGFRGNTKDYYDARNSYLNDVLDRRTGIPITLSLVAIGVGRRAGLEVSGVGLPGHFIAKAADVGRQVLFDPFHGGRLLSAEECELLVARTAGQPWEANARNLRPVPAGAVVRRMLANLKGVYLASGDFARAARVLGRLCQLVPGDVTQRRDLGVLLLRSGRPGPAIDHLAAYQAAAPDAPDASEVGALLGQARAAVASWN